MHHEGGEGNGEVEGRPGERSGPHRRRLRRRRQGGHHQVGLYLPAQRRQHVRAVRVHGLRVLLLLLLLDPRRCAAVGFFCVEVKAKISLKISYCISKYCVVSVGKWSIMVSQQAILRLHVNSRLDVELGNY